MYLLYYVCIAGVTLDAELLAGSQYSEGPATGYLDTGSSCSAQKTTRLAKEQCHIAQFFEQCHV
jgi:hypothetical protein